VDTGWSYTTISTNVASRLRTHRKPDLQPGDPFCATNEPSPPVVISSLSLGRIAFTNQPAVVQNMVFNGQRAPFDVVVGCDFLIRNFAVIDCSRRRLYTRRSSPSSKQLVEFEQALQQGGFLPVELRRTTPLALACAARLDGEAAELLVDTGAVWSCLDTGLAKSLGLKLLPTPRQISGLGGTGKRGFAVAKVNSVELGAVKMRNLNFAVLELGDWGLATPGAALAEVRAILGGPELAACRAIIDCHALRLWLKPPTARR
jgi:predicted aspartyl protease